MARKKGKRKGRSFSSPAKKVNRSISTQPTAVQKTSRNLRGRKAWSGLKLLILTAVLIVLSAMLFTAAFSGLATRLFSQTKPITPPTPSPDEKYAFHNQVRESVYTVAQGHKEGEELYRLLIDRGVDVYITEDGVFYSPSKWEIIDLPPDKFHLWVDKRMPPNSLLFSRVGYGEDATYTVLELPTADYTTTWLGVLILHELKHIHQYRVERLPRKAFVGGGLGEHIDLDREIAAHELGVRLLNHITKNEFQKAVDRVIVAEGISYPAQIFRVGFDFYPIINSLFPEERSISERDVRVKTYTFAINKRILEKAGVSPDVKTYALREWLRRFLTGDRSETS